MHTRRARRFLSTLIQSCTPVWFTPPTALASLALSLRLLPLARIDFPALTPLSTAFYLASLALFVPVSALFLLRLVLYPRETRRATVYERDTSGLELGYISSWPKCFVLLVSFGGFAVSEGKVGTGGAADGLALAVGMLAWLRRPEGEGGVGDGVGSGIGLFSPGLAGPMVVFSFCATGAAWFLATLDYGVLMHELVLVMGWPPPEHTGLVFALIGPLGQCASAVLLLAEAARRGDGGVALDGGDLVHSKVVTGLAAMAPLEVVCVLLALFTVGMAVVWLLLGIFTILYRMSRRELTWNPSWNGMVAPVSSLAYASILLSMELDSPFFRYVACVVIIACVLMVVVNLGFTIRLAVTAKSRREFTATGGKN
ncbi:hypothetical protein NEMBOFW57_006293 [Staphylotrichum longicolle]|uniref:Voltage-dependent anion channel n=1 Tax=Staphylotrichum longicolle TaxID=669026 RepID=A0AAD4EYG5_9PEZI|nr:hypothetical protein NEMBOFW57_006293 [Staphylotrichum longicolle]